MTQAKVIDTGANGGRFVCGRCRYPNLGPVRNQDESQCEACGETNTLPRPWKDPDSGNTST